MTLSISGPIPEAFAVFAWSLDADRRVSDFAVIDHRPLRDPEFKSESSAGTTIARAWITAANGRFRYTRGCDARDWLDPSAPLATPREVFDYLCDLSFSSADVRWSVVEGFAVVLGCDWIWQEVFLLAGPRGRPFPSFRAERRTAPGSTA